MMVYVLSYTHKHGTDLSVFGEMDTAERAAVSLMLERANEWDAPRTKEFREAAFSDRSVAFGDLLGMFHEVEQDFNYSEVIEIEERKVQ